MTSLENYRQAARAIADIIQDSNNIRRAAVRAEPLLDKVAALSGAAKIAFEAALTELGVTPAEFNALVTSMQSTIATVKTNLPAIKEKL